jgi:hypothetical protein
VPHVAGPTGAEDQASEFPRLRCLDGGQPPANLIQDWRAYQGLKAAARNALLEFIQQVYSLPLGRELAERVAKLAHQIGIEPIRAQNVLNSCRFLMGQGVYAGTSAEDFRKDLELLSPKTSDGVDEFVAHYEHFAPFRRGEVIQKSLLDHGKVMTGVDWRIQTVHASSHANLLETPVVLLTLNYASGSDDRSRNDSVSVQIPAEDVGRLRKTLESIEASLSNSETSDTPQS